MPLIHKKPDLCIVGLLVGMATVSLALFTLLVIVIGVFTEQHAPMVIPMGINTVFGWALWWRAEAERTRVHRDEVLRQTWWL